MLNNCRNIILTLAILAVCAVAGPASAETLINGAGATFPYPLYSKWFSEYAKVDPPGKTIHIPTVMEAVVVTYNLPGVAKGLKLSSEDVADIFLGRITKWNDPKLVRDNPGVKLPNQPIIVVHRSDGSGTTSIFTDCLSGVSAEWKSKVGMG